VVVVDDPSKPPCILIAEDEALVASSIEEVLVPSIFLSGLADAETVHRAEAAHPLGFLQKPFRPSQMFNAIQRALSPQGG